MLDSLKIQNFKAIENLEIPELGQINLITGKNNTCKTSVLEAVSILVSGFDLEWVEKLLKDRNELKINEDTQGINYIASIISFFKDNVVRLHKDTLIGDNSFYLKYNIEYLTLDSQKILRTEDLRSPLPLTSVFGVRNANSNVVFNIKNFDQLLILDYFSKIIGKANFEFVNSSLVNDEINAKLWDKLVFSDKKEYIYDALRLIENNIVQIDFVGGNGNGKNRKALVNIKDKDRNKSVVLKSMGDGINRILTIVLSMVNAENGYLFIDEIENGLHYSVQVQLWETIYFLAKRLNVQVFATTHSSDAVAAFSIVTAENENLNLGRVIKLQRKNDELKAIVFSHDDLKIAYEQDLNLR